jgi:glycosyltransferase involved in cell wall biosynthesis
MTASLTVGCPAFNEEVAIAQVVRRYLELIPSIADDFELLLVDDGSTDRTGVILDELAREEPRMRVIHHPKNLGFAGFARTLIANATKELYVGISADGEIRVEDVLAMRGRMDEGFDVVVGVRTHKPNYSRYRKLVSWSYNRLVFVLFGYDFLDIGGPKLWRTRYLRGVDLISASAFMNAELLIGAARRGARIGFVTIEQQPRLGGRAKGATVRRVLEASRDLVRVSLRLATWPGSSRRG